MENNRPEGVTSWLERYIYVTWVIFAIILVVCLNWGLDRRVPFQLISYSVFNAAPGETLFVSAEVKRDITRSCSVTFSRALIDSNGVRHDLGVGAYMSVSALRDMEESAPNTLRFALRMPNGTAPGPAMLVTPLSYQCNPMHKIWPVETLMKMRVQVLP